MLLKCYLAALDGLGGGLDDRVLVAVLVNLVLAHGGVQHGSDHGGVVHDGQTVVGQNNL